MSRDNPLSLNRQLRRSSEAIRGCYLTGMIWKDGRCEASGNMAGGGDANPTWPLVSPYANPNCMIDNEGM